MTDEEEIEILKKGVLRRPRTTFTILVIAGVLSVFSIIYGTTQKIEASKQNAFLKIELEHAEALRQQIRLCESERTK